jgi:hypothetical protein
MRPTKLVSLGVLLKFDCSHPHRCSYKARDDSFLVRFAQEVVALPFPCQIETLLGPQNAHQFQIYRLHFGLSEK